MHLGMYVLHTYVFRLNHPCRSNFIFYILLLLAAIHP